MLSKTYWLSLSQTTRQSLRILLDIPRSSGAEVFGNTVVSDGFTDSDLATVDLPKLQAYMRSESVNFYELLETLIYRIEHPIVITPPQAIQAPPSVEDRLEVVEDKVKELEPTNKVLYDIPKADNKPIYEKKKSWGRQKGDKVVNGKLIRK
jgi:hypothetical protein